jgi:hypothetical protein
VASVLDELTVQVSCGRILLTSNFVMSGTCRFLDQCLDAELRDCFGGPVGLLYEQHGTAFFIICGISADGSFPFRAMLVACEVLVLI